MTSFDSVLARLRWFAIPNCPGRYVLRGQQLTIEQVLGARLDREEHHVAATADAILVTRFPGGGLLTFQKPDGTLVHTLNTSEGLTRRLAKLGIA